jgi:hypothetical protein
MKLKYLLSLPVGMVMLGIALLMEKFLPSNNFLDFIVGLLIGLSLVLNIYYIGSVIRHSRKEK